MAAEGKPFSRMSFPAKSLYWHLLKRFLREGL